MSMKKRSDTIGNITRDLPTAPPRAPNMSAVMAAVTFCYSFWVFPVRSATANKNLQIKKWNCMMFEFGSAMALCF
jgi:hypothetical protein